MADGSPAPIVVHDLTKSYPQGASAVSALQRVSFELKRFGEMVALAGRSGSGKSTLLNLLGGMDRPTRGSVTVLGQALHELSERELTEYRLRTVGFVFQSFNLIPNLTALENVALPMVFAHTSRAERKTRAHELLDTVGMGKRASHTPPKLSGGEQQRVAIARALANDAPILLADEPTGNLDSETGANILNLLKTLARERNRLVLVSTHDQDVIKEADREIRLRDGRLKKG